MPAPCLVTGSLPVSATRAPFGQLCDGSIVEAITLAAECGISARILSYGATLQSLIAPDANGVLADIVLGHDDVAGYEQTRGYLGVTIGRYANRIAGGRFMLDGVTYQLQQNDGPNCLHGGDHGFDRALWQVDSVTQGAEACLVLSHVSPDGEGGFPGEVSATVTYRLSPSGALTILFEATTTRPTVINMTNHALFNLAGDGAPQGAMLHTLTLAAQAYTPIDATSAPTGEIRPVAGSAFDFRDGRIIGEAVRDGRDPQIVIGRGYDHNFALDKGLTSEPLFAARLEDPYSGRRLEVLTTEPGLQLFTANWLHGTVLGKQGRLYRMGDGIALEPQKFPDSPNQPGWDSARVDPGTPYRHAMILRMTTTPGAG